VIFENLNKLNLVDEDLKVIIGDVLTMGNFMLISGLINKIEEYFFKLKACSRRNKSVILKILIKFDQIYLIKHLDNFISIGQFI
jgi:hypothetical protein